MRTLALLGLCVGLSAGCAPLTRHVTADVTVPAPVSARLEANLTAALDEGPVVEVEVEGADCKAGAGKVAIIEVDGLLVNYNPVGPYSAGENPVALFQEKLNAAAADAAVKAIVLRINTPGGGVAATDLMRHAVEDLRARTAKPIVACLLDLATGGGYYIASSCDAIVAMPTAVVGGIGVLLNLYYAEVAMEQMNVFNAGIKAGERIDMGTPTRKVTDEERKLFSGMAQEYHAAFKQAVRYSRKRVAADASCFDGRVMTAQQALSEGLVDSVGYLKDALVAAADLAGTGPLRPVMYCRHGSPARSLLATTSNRPVHATALPWSVPGLDRSRLPVFLYLWQPEPTMLRLTGM